MPSSMMSPTRILTILSLVALCTLSFTVVFGSNNIFDTLTRDTLAHDSPFSLPKNDIVHHRRALHHARQSIALPISASNSPQANPSQSAPSSDANTQSSSAPFSSQSPSSSAQPSPSSSPSPTRETSTSLGTSAASPSSSPSSTLTPSSSSNPQVSSSHGVTSPSVGAASNANNPVTTFNNPIYTSGFSGHVPTATGSTLTIGATPTVGASSGFFQNKAAVGATFSIIGIVGGLAAIMAVLTIMKRRRRAARRAREDEEYFDKYQSMDFGEPIPHSPRDFGIGSGAASVMDIGMNAAPADAYPDRAIHYGQSDAGAVLSPVDYGIAYPPGTANHNSNPANGSGNMPEDTESAYSVPSASHPFADPANSSVTTAAPQVTYPRPIQGRAQGIVATDSYYGPNSAGIGASGIGYAQ